MLRKVFKGYTVPGYIRFHQHRKYDQNDDFVVVKHYFMFELCVL